MNRLGFFLLFHFSGLLVFGCNGPTKELSTPQQSELEKYLSEHPESANAEMAEFKE